MTTRTAFVSRDRPDTETAYDERVTANPDVVIYRISGVMFFGATASIGSVLDRINDDHKARKCDVELWLTGASRDIRRAFITQGLKRPLVRYAASVDDALAVARGADPAPRETA